MKEGTVGHKQLWVLNLVDLFSVHSFSMSMAASLKVLLIHIYEIARRFKENRDLQFTTNRSYLEESRWNEFQNYYH